MADGVARLGIDFGTANTVAVVALPAKDPRPLLFDGTPLLPSAVCADINGRLLVGRDAIHTATAHPESFEPHPKRCIDDSTVLLGERDVPVTDLIGAVLRRVTDEASRVAGAPIAEAVLTYPASWGSSRRGTLLEAASSALPTVRLVAEPIAVANHFVSSTDELPVGGAALVYDFGAGTFDASVVRRTAGGFDILATQGLADCGGLDLDAATVAYLGAVLRERDPAGWARLASPQTPADRRASRQLWDNVRTAKEMLSRVTSTLVHVPLLELDAPLGRAQLEEMAGPVLERTVKASKAVLRDAGISPADLAAVFLAGGSSRMPAVATAVHRALGIVPAIIDQPELATAEGTIQSPSAPSGTAATEPVDPSWPSAAAPAVRDGAGAHGRAGLPPGAALPPGLGSRLGAGSWLGTGSWLGAAGSVRRRRLAVGGSALAVLAITGALATQLAHSPDQPDGSAAGAARSPAASVTSPTPTASPSVTYAAGVDPCLVGTWRRTRSNKFNKIDDQQVEFIGGSGETIIYRANGTMFVRFASTVSATHKGVRWKEIVRGTVNARYRAANGTLIYSSPKATGTWKLTRNGSTNNSGKVSLSVEPERYVCTDTTFTAAASFYSQEYVRVVPATPSPTALTPSAPPAQ